MVDDAGRATAIIAAKAAMLDHLMATPGDTSDTSTLGWISRRALPEAATCRRMARLAIETLERLAPDQAGRESIEAGLHAIIADARADDFASQDATCDAIWAKLGPRSREQLMQACGLAPTKPSRTRKNQPIAKAAENLLERDPLRACGLRPTTLGRQVAERTGATNATTHTKRGRVAREPLASGTPDGL